MSFLELSEYVSVASGKITPHSQIKISHVFRIALPWVLCGAVTTFCGNVTEIRWLRFLITRGVILAIAIVAFIPANFCVSERSTSLYQMHKRGPLYKKRKPKRPLDGNPFMKGVVLKTLIKKPKKPNSANRKCVLVRLSNGKEMVAYVPGIGHNLQEHNIVLVRVGRLKDCPGVKLKCVRGKYDLGHVVPVKK